MENLAIFQPTLPARGATGRFVAAIYEFVISTHAPRTGSDTNAAASANAAADFNPRSPHGERRISFAGSPQRHLFQPTLPARGATTVNERIYDVQQDFNPRSPHGERRRQEWTYLRRNDFNPRSPHGERQQIASGVHKHAHISTHAPRTGSDSNRGNDAAGGRNFNPRSPHGERLRICRSNGGRKYFNPRSPHGERPYNPGIGSFVVGISTHAPRTGSDLCRRCPCPRPAYFNPRSPHGERPRHLCQGRGRGNFNPRSPHGERRDRKSSA